MTTYVSNKKASFNYELLETFEAGIVLSGTEVKSIRNGRGKLEGAHVLIRDGEAFLVGASIPAYQKKNTPKGYDPEMVRKLLLSKKELAHLAQESDQNGLTIVPLQLYNTGQNIKLKIAIARGKKKHDKRETIKERDTKRALGRLLKKQ